MWPRDAPTATLRPGSSLADYRVWISLGSGRYGTVYRATHARLGMAVALRVAEPQGPAAAEARAELVADSLAVAALSHPGFVPILQAADLEGSCFVAMALIEHETLLTRAVEAGGLDPAAALGIVGRVAEALDAAHLGGLVHGRLCARRILMAGSRPYISGVGFGRRGPWDASPEELDVLDGVAPEQVEDGGAIDARADVYALGCLLVRVLSGAPPFPRDCADEVLDAHVVDPPPTSGRDGERWDPRLDEVIATALAKEPGDRYATCGDLVVAARAALLPGEGGRAAPQQRRFAPATEAGVVSLEQPQDTPREGNGALAPARAAARVAAASDRRPASTDTGSAAEPLPSSETTARPEPAGPGDPTGDAVAARRADPDATLEQPAAGAAAVPRTDPDASLEQPAAAGAAVPQTDPDATLEQPVVRASAEQHAEPRADVASQVRRPVDDASGAPPAADDLPEAGRGPARGRRPLMLALLGLALVGALVAAVLLASRGGEPTERPQAAAPERPSATRPSAARPAAPAPVPASTVRAAAPVALGGTATAFALIPGGVWVTDARGDAVARLDRRGRPLDQRVPVAADPSAITSGAGGLWVTSAGTNTVTNLDSEDGSALGEPIPVGDDPQAVALGARSVWVANRGDGTLSRIDRAAGQVVDAPVTVGAQPSAVATTEDFVWVANSGDGTVSRVDIETRRPAGEPIPVGALPSGLAVGARSVWVANTGDGTVSRISVRRGRVLGEPIRVGGRPAALAFGGRYVWVADAARRQVVRLRASDGRLAGRPIRLADTPSRIRVGSTAVWVLGSAGTITRIPFAS